MKTQPIQRFYLFVGLAGFLYLAGALALAYGRPAWCDEAWYGYPAWMLVTTGHVGTPILEGAGTTLRTIAQYTYWEMPGHILAQAIAYKLLGISLFSTRLLPILWGLVALAAWHSILFQLTARRNLALLSTAILATDYLFVLSAAVGRADIMSTATGALGLALYLHWREQYLSRALLAAHTCLMVSGLTHPNGGMFYLALWLYLAIWQDRQRIQPRHLLLVVLPYVVGGAAWGTYILQDFTAFREQFGANASGRFSGLLQPLRALASEITVRYFTTFGLTGDTAWGGVRLLKSFVLLVYTVVVIGVTLVPTLRRDPVFRPVYFLFLIGFSVLTFLDASKQHYYLLHLLPLFSALVAVFVLWGWAQAGLLRMASGLLLAGLILVQAGGIAYRAMKDDRHRQFAPAAQYLVDHIAPGQTVFATAAFGFDLNWPAWLHDDVRLGYFSGRVPDYFVVDESYLFVHRAFAGENPGLHAFLENRKTQEYQVVFENALYKIYQHK